ncbi:MAG: hypothetical protein ACTMUB_10030 [cyanobacterium endosymbiont of Rhopalodia musculus]|uniref:hypothetical protein n=1 Tax=cyanobacterium endosymbiont of Epithemia clementina EcSB TaxID=3034674 RepID=UPI00248052EB|nr:hypothetical protein [cyanobacterium endosymbiont of Epithemia clementina EcSB]WGT68368.1 hypothetical protein P3F56_04820 [cyanobacterium endosymbiont of Epithemia clementina EcSB]
MLTLMSLRFLEPEEHLRCCFLPGVISPKYPFPSLVSYIGAGIAVACHFTPTSM